MYDRNDSSLKEIRLEFETMLPVVEAMRAQPHKVTSKNSGQTVLVKASIKCRDNGKR